MYLFIYLSIWFNYKTNALGDISPELICFKPQSAWKINPTKICCLETKHFFQPWYMSVKDICTDSSYLSTTHEKH